MNIIDKFKNSYVLLEKNMQKYKNFNKDIYMEELEQIKIKNGECKRKCPYCERILSSVLNYYKHIEKSICRKQKINTCNLCNKYFSRKSNYDYHINNKVCNKFKNNHDNNIINYKPDQNILDKIYLEEYRKIIREKINENLINKDIKQITEKNNIPLKRLEDAKNLHLKYKKVKISNIFKMQCWNHWIGEDIGKIICPVCKIRYITQMTFSCAHIKNKSKSNNLEPENVRPVCSGCKHFCIYQ